MYKYKINNSYTFYVNEGYYWDVKRDCDKRRKTKLSGGARAAQKSCPEMVLTAVPLSNGTIVYSKYFGTGIVRATDSKGIMVVQFAEKTVHFIYPDVIKKGQLKVVQ